MIVPCYVTSQDSAATAIFGRSSGTRSRRDKEPHPSAEVRRACSPIWSAAALAGHKLQTRGVPPRIATTRTHSLGPIGPPVGRRPRLRPKAFGGWADDD